MKSLFDSQLVVWIIDDDLVSLFATRYGIEQWKSDCNVFDFDSGETALKMFSDILDSGGATPDVILLDLVMPKMNGWEFITKMESIQSPLKYTDIYILSAFTNSKDRKMAETHPSVRGYFDKPVSKNVLDDILVLK